ncbi:MAG TPA: AraC family transcriptional regulator ligand-binding domain-containing protein [Caulobacterales bacterium]|nr:AraC family transcriptional regulator ligand-binding domain-containing protein [Caulobacterales bacterium]
MLRTIALQGLPELVAELGGDFDALCAEIGFDPASARDLRAFMSARVLYTLMNHAAARLKRPDLGLMWGARSDLTRLGPLYTAMANAATGREAVAITIRYLALHFPVGMMRVRKIPEAKREFISIASHLSRPPVLAQFFERRVRSLHLMLGKVCARYAPAEIWFAHEPLSPLSIYESHFGIAPRFGAPENGLLVSAADLDAPRANANAEMREMALSFLESRTARRRDSLSAEAFWTVRAIMCERDCTATAAARALSIHPRTLQRRLKAEGTSFETIKDRVRRRMARELLAEPALTVTEIAFSLHYATVSSFTRSCRRWYGRSPREVRDRLRNGEKRLRHAPA